MSRRRLGEWTLPGLLVVGIVAAAVVAAIALSALDGDRDRELRDARYERSALAVREAFEEPVEDLIQVANGAAVIADPSPEEFEALAEPVLDRPEVQTVSLIERVAGVERAAFERRSGLRIRDVTPTSSTPAPDRTVHYVVVSSVSRKPIEPGIDVAANAERVGTIVRAVGTGEPAFTAPVKLLNDDSRAVISAIPVDDDHVVFAALTFDRVAASLARRLPPGTAVTIDDGGAPITAVGSPGGGARETKFAIGGREWTVRTQVVGADGTPWAALVLAIGLLLASAVGAFAFVLRRRERSVAAAAAARAAERDAATAEAGRERSFSATLLGAMPDAFAADDQNGLIVVNDALCALTGFDREELIGRRFPFGFWPEESLSEVSRVRDHLDERGFAQAELTLRTKGGERIPVLVSASTVSGADGPVRINVLSDNRRGAAARAALERSETELRELAEASSDMVLRLSLAERVQWASPSTERVLGHPAEGLVGRRFRDLFEDFGTGTLGEDALVGRMRRADGRLAWTETTVTPTHNALGETTGMRASIRDVTEREESRRTLARSEERYRTLAQSLPGMVVFMVDRDLRFVLVEGGALGTSGYVRDQIEGRLVSEVLTGPGLDTLLPRYQAALRGEESEVEHASHVTGHTYCTRFIPLRDDAGAVEGAMVVTLERDKAAVPV